jgi:hypothetical protein
LWGLLPGDYLVGAAPLLQRQAREVTSDEVAWAESQLRAARPGVPPSAAAPAGRPAPAPPSDPVRVFYPGTADVAAASVVTLETGEERAGVDFPMQSVSSAVIRGTLTGFDPARQFPFLTLSQVGVPLAMTRDSIPWRNNNGVMEFATRGLPPGRYRIMARLNAPSSAGTTSEPRNLWAMEDVTLDAAGVNGVSLALRPGLVVSGRVAFDGASPAPDLATLRVTFAPVASPDAPQAAPQQVVIAPDGTFSIGSVVPGRYRFTAPVAAAGRRGAAADPSMWVLKSVVYGRQDVLDLPVEVTPTSQVNGIVMTWFDRAGMVDGHVSDPAGQAVTDDTVILFPVDSRYWGLPSRRTLRMLPGPAGRFQFAGVLPGDYYLALTTDLSPTDLTDSSVFAALAQSAIKVSVAAGATTSQEIRIAGQ